MKLEADRKLDRVCPRPDLRVVFRLMGSVISQIHTFLLSIRYLVRSVTMKMDLNQFVI